ncbi:MAG: TetR/AcrR family transcriptional regulator [bacterium]|nr:TetR/AcrR family transcriptional regulator [bacterium]
MARSNAQTSASRPPGRAGRPRDPEADRLIIAATLEIMAQRGYEGIRVADVAERAGVAKATMYRRWASKADLVVAALQSAPPLSPVDTGDLRRDLLSLLEQFLELTESAPIIGLLATLAAERQKNPELARRLDPFVAERMAPISQAFRRAISRGEVAPEADLDLATTLLGGAAVMRLFFGGAMDNAAIEGLVDLVLHAHASPQ